MKRYLATLTLVLVLGAAAFAYFIGSKSCAAEEKAGNENDLVNPMC